MWKENADSVIKQVLMQSTNGNISDFYALINTEPKYSIYTRDDERAELRKRIRKTAEMEKIVHLYKC